MEPTSAPRPWRLPFYGWIVVVVVCALGAIGLWLVSDRDLVAFDAKARAAGIKPTWEEVGLVASPPEHLVRWRRLMQLAESLKSYQETSEWRPRVGEPTPPELAAHHAALSEKDLGEVVQLIDGLPPEAIREQTSVSYDTRLDDASSVRALSRLFAERITLAHDPAIVEESRRLLAVATAQQSMTLIQDLVEVSCLAIWQSAIAGRHASPGLDREAIAAYIDTLRNHLEATRNDCMDKEVRLWRDVIWRVQRGEAKVVKDLESSLEIPGWLRGYGVGRCWARMGRSPSLDLLLDNAVAWRTSTSFPTRAKNVGAVQLRVEAIPTWQPACRMVNTMMPATSLLHESWMKADTGLAVLAAELRQAPWPIDPTDPAGLPVRRIERDGRLIGYYLVGRNGVDDHGKVSNSTGDYCFALYERLGSPMATDPLKPDPAPRIYPPGPPPGMPPGMPPIMPSGRR